MPKRIEPMEKRDIIRRLKEGQGLREIARETGISRNTVKAVRAWAVATGWLKNEALPKEEELFAIEEGRHPLDVIADKLKEWQEQGYTYLVMTKLVNDYGYKYSDITIRRYVQKRWPVKPRVVIPRTFEPGETAEVDFGFLGTMKDEDEGRMRKAWMFSMRLNRSRKTYREVVTDQSVRTFLSCHIHGFEHFQGVPKKIVCDNLKAAVIKACREDPEVNKSYLMLAEHYGFLISACQPGKPEHKGGVEKDVDYVKRNFLPVFLENEKKSGRDAPRFQACREALERWTGEVDDRHTVKYTGQTPEEMFVEERGFLKPLPAVRWDVVEWRTAKVGSDWKVQVDRAFYSVPYEHVGREVRVCINSAQVVIYYEYQEIARHRRARRSWQRMNLDEHAPPQYAEYLQATSAGVRKWAAMLGDSVSRVVEQILGRRGVDGLRPARALCALGQKFGVERLKKACERALYYQALDFMSVKNILICGKEQEPIREEEVLIKAEAFKYARPKEYFDT